MHKRKHTIQHRNKNVNGIISVDTPDTIYPRPSFIESA